MQIEMNNVSKKYINGDTEQCIIDHVSTLFQHNQTYAITGASGSGKSTLLHLLAGFDMPTSGTIFHNGINTAHISLAKREQLLMHTIGMLFQQPFLINSLTVVENIIIKHHALGMPTKIAQERGLYLLEKIDLAHTAHYHPAQLSGGQQQRIATARALFCEPSFLLADEPTGNLDNATKTMMVDFLLQCADEWHMGMIISSHDPYVASAMHQILQLHNGSLVSM